MSKQPFRTNQNAVVPTERQLEGENLAAFTELYLTSYLIAEREGDENRHREISAELWEALQEMPVEDVFATLTTSVYTEFTTAQPQETLFTHILPDLEPDHLASLLDVVDDNFGFIAQLTKTRYGNGMTLFQHLAITHPQVCTDHITATLEEKRRSPLHLPHDLTPDNKRLLTVKEMTQIAEVASGVLLLPLSAGMTTEDALYLVSQKAQESEQFRAIKPEVLQAIISQFSREQFLALFETADEAVIVNYLAREFPAETLEILGVLYNEDPDNNSVVQMLLRSLRTISFYSDRTGLDTSFSYFPNDVLPEVLRFARSGADAVNIINKVIRDSRFTNLLTENPHLLFVLMDDLSNKECLDALMVPNNEVDVPNFVKCVASCRCVDEVVDVMRLVNSRLTLREVIYLMEYSRPYMSLLDEPLAEYMQNIFVSLTLFKLQ